MAEGARLNGQQKAACLMLALNEEQAAALFAKMDDEEIGELSLAMANLGTMNSETIEEVFMEFAASISGTGSLRGSYESTERALKAAGMDSDRVNNILDNIRGPAGRTLWDKLGNVNEATLATYLKNEYPQTVAVVLGQLRAENASRVLSMLPEEFAMEVMMRMLGIQAVRKEVLDSVEQTLRNEFMTNLSRTTQRDSHEMIAEIFNNFDRSTEQRFMASLEERNQDSAEKIKALMFTFEDLVSLDPNGVQVLLRNVEKSALATALKGASETLRDLFFSNMSERAGKILREDMDSMGPVRLREVDEAQTAMVAAAKDLSDRGEIVLAAAGGEDELVY